MCFFVLEGTNFSLKRVFSETDQSTNNEHDPHQCMDEERTVLGQEGGWKARGWEGTGGGGEGGSGRGGGRQRAGGNRNGGTCERKQGRTKAIGMAMGVMLSIKMYSMVLRIWLAGMFGGGVFLHSKEHRL